MIASTGKVLLIVGLVVAALGLAMILADRPGFWRDLLARLPLGRLPGDLRWRGEGYSVYFPWVTCLVVSVIVTILLSFFRK